MSLKVIVIDDELPAVEVLRDLLLEQQADLQIHTFTSGEDANAQLGKIRPDLLFLDMEMPELSGIQLAARWAEDDFDHYLVFVTAYERYALDAFAVGAQDYLLKPVEPERLRETLHRFAKRTGRTRVAHQEDLEHALVHAAERAVIRCFGHFEVGGPTGQVRWNTAKTEELFAYLVIHRTVSIEQLYEDIFPGFEQEKASNYARNCLFHIRKGLKRAGLEGLIEVRYVNRMYTVTWNEAEVHCDVEQFARAGDCEVRV